MKTVPQTGSIFHCGLVYLAWSFLFYVKLLNRQTQVNTILTNMPLNPPSVAVYFLNVGFYFLSVFFKIKGQREVE